MVYRVRSGDPKLPPKIIDITDGDEQLEIRPYNIHGVDMTMYRKRVEEALENLFDKDPTLQKIRNGEQVSENDLLSLSALILTQNPDVDLELLKEFYPDTAAPLDYIIRTIVGMDPDAVAVRFVDFVIKHPSLDAKQTKFLGLLKNHIAKYGAIEIDQLYEAPFTSIDAGGLDGVFEDEEAIEDLIAVLETFKPAETEMQ